MRRAFSKFRLDPLQISGQSLGFGRAEPRQRSQKLRKLAEPLAGRNRTQFGYRLLSTHEHEPLTSECYAVDVVGEVPGDFGDARIGNASRTSPEKRIRGLLSDIRFPPGSPDILHRRQPSAVSRQPMADSR
jgi:hypothetical protein